MCLSLSCLAALAPQAVDPRVALPYWEYTLDTYHYGPDWASESPVFADGWLGAASPNNSAHALDAGRWAYTRVTHLDTSSSSGGATADAAASVGTAEGVGAITNPYGLLRSPWNTWKVPYVTRHGRLFGSTDYDSFPSCEQLDACFASGSTADLNACLNGYTHGPVHIMLGGQWWGGWETANGDEDEADAAVPTVSSSSSRALLGGAGAAFSSSAARDDRGATRDAMETFGLTKVFLLVAKNLWRRGYMRCPAACSADAPQASCECSCPAEYTTPTTSAARGNRTSSGDAADDDDDDDAIARGDVAYDILVARTGVMHWVDFYSDRIFWNASATAGGDGGATGRYRVRGYGVVDEARAWSTLLGLLCNPRFAGEMYTSAAPWDPAFWLVHPTADRLMQYRRLAAARTSGGANDDGGALALDEAWSYTHDSRAPSDTGVVCDWTAADAAAASGAAGGALALPSCARGTCPGHAAEDLLPMRVPVRVSRRSVARGGGGGDGGGAAGATTTTSTRFVRMTNLEFYEYMSPLNGSSPYVYDSFRWDHCDAQGYDFAQYAAGWSAQTA